MKLIRIFSENNLSFLCSFKFFKIKLLILTALLYLSSGNFVYSSEPLNQPQNISFIGHLNFDCLADTIFSQRINGRFLLPVEIHWGKGDSLKCGFFHSDSVIVPKTEIVYPVNFLSGSFSAMLVNNDSITDMLISLKTSDTSSVKYVIFGQNDLDMIDTVYLSQIIENQASPFYATKLSEGQGLKNPDFRDPGGQLSYEFEQINLNLNPIIPPKVSSIVDDLLNTNLKFSVFPNPASDALFYRVEGNTQGDFTITISSILSNSLVKIKIGKKSQFDFSGQIDISNLTPGVYCVNLERNNLFFTSKPIIILR